MFKTSFLTHDQAKSLATKYGTPLFVYSRSHLNDQIIKATGITVPYGLTVRYAMKANPRPEILKIIRADGVEIDASSEYEALEAVKAGFKPNQILLTTQQMPKKLKQLVNDGVKFNASSLKQLEVYGNLFPGSEVSVRLNPGIGSGFSKLVTVGGMSSSFGIWHEYIPEIRTLAEKYNLKLVRLHTQIGSGADPDIWLEAAKISLDMIKQFPSVAVLNLGGGFKVERIEGEKGADMREVGRVLSYELVDFAQQTGRRLKLEIEPGTFVTANSAVLISTIDDIVDTGKYGYTFIKLDTGMNDFVRPAMYGSQHPMEVATGASETKEYVVVGHTCESADVFTVQSDNPGVIKPRRMKKAAVGDIMLIGGVGAYCAAMAMHGYNGFPNAKEVIID